MNQCAVCVYVYGINTKVDTCLLRNTHGTCNTISSYEGAKGNWHNSNWLGLLPPHPINELMSPHGMSSWLSWSPAPMKLLVIALACKYIYSWLFFVPHILVDSKMGFNACWPNLWCLNKFSALYATNCASMAVWETEEELMLPTTGKAPKVSGSFSVYRTDSYTVMVFDSYQGSVFLEITAGGCLPRWWIV